MKFSFIIPAYNCKEYLPACVSSIRAIDMEAYEILLIDDGSTDGSGALCNELAARFPEVRVIHQENAGASAARNRGLQEAEGEFILFVDADDCIDPHALRAVLEDSRCDQTDLVLYGLTFDYYKNGTCYRSDAMFYPIDGILQKQQWGAAYAELYSRNSLSPVWNKVFRRDILVCNDLRMNENMFLYEDFEFVLRYMQHCESIWNVPKAVYHYRQSEDEGNAKRRLTRIDSIPAFLQPIEEALQGLVRSNAAVSLEQTEKILQQLYLTLAREKISGSAPEGIQQICRDFIRWSSQRNLPLDVSKFQKDLMEEKVWNLILADKKSALRHKLAIWVKSHLYKV